MSRALESVDGMRRASRVSARRLDLARAKLTMHSIAVSWRSTESDASLWSGQLAVGASRLSYGPAAAAGPAVAATTAVAASRARMKRRM